MARARTRDYVSTAPAKSYSAPTGVAGPGSTRRATAEDFGGVGAGLVTAGKGLANFATELQKRQEQADVTHAAMLQTTAVTEISQSIMEARRTAQPGAPHHVDNVKGIINEWFNNDERRSTVNTAKGRAKYQEVAGSVMARFVVNEVGYAAEASGKYVKDQFKDNLNTASLILLTDPSDTALVEQINSLTDLINDPNGVIANSKGLNAGDREELLKDGIEKLLTSQVQGRIRSDKNSEFRGPEKVIEDIDAGVYHGRIDKDMVKFLRNEAWAEIGRNKEKTAAEDAAEKARLAELREKSYTNFAKEFDVGTIKEGDTVETPVNPKAFMDRVYADTYLTGKDKEHFSGRLEARAKGDNPFEFDQHILRTQNTLLGQFTTGRNSDGSPINWAEVMDDIKRGDAIGAYGGEESRETLAVLADNKINNYTGPQARRQLEIYRMVVTKKDRDGNTISDSQMAIIVRDDDLLDERGPAGKAAFRKIIRESTANFFQKTAGFTFDDVYSRIFLSKDDPNRMTADDMRSDPSLIAKVGGTKKIEELIKIANNYKDEQKKPLEASIKLFVERYKGYITKSIAGAEVDAAGDDRYASFINHVRRLVAKHEEDGGDPYILFDSRVDNPLYLGQTMQIAQRYGIALREAVTTISPRIKGAIPIYRSKAEDDPSIQALENETPDEYLKRVGNK